MLAGLEANKMKDGDRDINNTGKIAGKIAASKSPIIEIWNFLSKLELSSCLM